MKHRKGIPYCFFVINRLLNGWELSDPSSNLVSFYRKRLELSLADGVILWHRRVVVPTALQARVLALLHEGHAGIVRMKSLARSYVWWPGLDDQLDMLTKDCLECSENRCSPPPVKGAAWLVPEHPWHRLHIDFSGPIAGGKMIFVVVDATTKWPEIFEMKSTTAAAVVDVLREVFARFGHPFEIVSDNGPQFASEEFQSFLRRSGIEHRMGAPFHPQTNGLLSEWFSPLSNR